MNLKNYLINNNMINISHIKYLELLKQFLENNGFFATNTLYDNYYNVIDIITIKCLGKHRIIFSKKFGELIHFDFIEDFSNCGFGSIHDINDININNSFHLKILKILIKQSINIKIYTYCTSNW